MKFLPIPTLSSELIKRFLSKVVKTDGCWLWQGWLAEGYGKFYYNNKGYRPHRISYTLHKGEIPKGLVVDHLCRNRGCVNPDHLEPVTFRENYKRGPRCLVTHCPRGHEYSKENTYINRKGARTCRECHRISGRKRYAERKK